MNAEAGGNGYYLPDLPAYRRLAERAARRVSNQASKLALLDMEMVPRAPGHTGATVDPGTPLGAPHWRLWREGKTDECCYGWRHMRQGAQVVFATPGVDVMIYAGLPAWVDWPPPLTWEETREYREMRAVEDSYLLGSVNAACVDAYPWWSPSPLADWEVDFSRRLERAPAGKPKVPLLYFTWQDGPKAKQYVGDELAGAMLDGCRRRGFEFLAVFEPPAEAWNLLLEFVGT